MGCVGCVSHKHIITFHDAVISAPNYCLVTGKCSVCKGIGAGGVCGVCESTAHHYIPWWFNQCTKLLPCHW